MDMCFDDYDDYQPDRLDDWLSTCSEKERLVWERGEAIAAAEDTNNLAARVECGVGYGDEDEAPAPSGAARLRREAKEIYQRASILMRRIKQIDTPRVVHRFAPAAIPATTPRARARKSHGSGQKSNDDGSGDPDPDEPPRGRLLTPADLSRYLGKSRQNVYDLLSKKDWSRIPPPIYVGSSPRWRLADVDRWLDDLAARQAGMDRPADYWRLQQPEPAAPPPKRGRPRKAPVSADQKGGAK